MFQARACLDQLVTDFGGLHPLSHIRKNAAVIESKHFENGIYRIQAGLESTLSQHPQEKAAVKFFLKAGARDDDGGAPPPTTATVMRP